VVDEGGDERGCLMHVGDRSDAIISITANAVLKRRFTSCSEVVLTWSPCRFQSGSTNNVIGNPHQSPRVQQGRALNDL